MFTSAKRATQLASESTTAALYGSEPYDEIGLSGVLGSYQTGAEAWDGILYIVAGVGL